MKVSEELSDEQARQVSRQIIDTRLRCLTCSQLIFDVEHAYAEFFRSLGGEKDHT